MAVGTAAISVSPFEAKKTRIAASVIALASKISRVNLRTRLAGRCVTLLGFMTALVARTFAGIQNAVCRATVAHRCA